MDTQSNAVILARVSSKAQEDEGYSLDSQLKLLKGYCERNNLNVIKVFKIAETASKNQSRKVFHEMLDYISKENICHLAVEKTDRFTRNFRDAVSIDEWLEQNENRRLHAVKENILLHKNAKSDVKFMWNIHLSVAKKYTDNLREEAMKGWAEKLAQGWLPAPPPPGYITVTEGGKRVHIPNLETKCLIIRAFKLYLEPNHSIATITHELEVMGLRTRKGRPYSKSNVQLMLENPFYIGINRFNGKDYPGAQETFISKEVFNKVQQKMHKKTPIIYKKHNPTFKNMIRCDGCNGIITWQLQKGRYYGRCQRKSEICKSMKNLREDRVEELIMEHLAKLVCPSEEIISWVASSMREQHKQSIEQYEKQQISLQSQIDRINRMDDDLYEDKLAGDITKERYKDKHEQFIVQKNELEDQLNNLEQSSGVKLEKKLVLLELSQKAAKLFPKKLPEQKRLIIIKLFKNISSNDGVVSVNYTKFAGVIAQKVQLSNELIGGLK
jgi:site-specific DNA recombinase